MRSRQAQNMVNLGSINEIVEMSKDVLSLLGRCDYSDSLFQQAQSLKDIFETGDMVGTSQSLSDLNTFLDTTIPPVSEPPFTLIKQSLSDVVNNLIVNLIVNEQEDNKEQERDTFIVTAMLQEAQNHVKNRDTVKASITLRKIQRFLKESKNA
jgi:hypothetical protein